VCATFKRATLDFYSGCKSSQYTRKCASFVLLHPWHNNLGTLVVGCGPGSAFGIATALWTGQSGNRIPVGARFSAPVQTGPGAHPASCSMGTRSFPGVKSGRGMTLAPHPLLVLWLWKGRAIPLLPLWAAQPVQSLSACTRVTFTFYTCWLLSVIRFIEILSILLLIN